MADLDKSITPVMPPYSRHLFLCKGCVPNSDGVELEQKVVQMLDEWNASDNSQRVKVSMVSCLDVCKGGQIGVVYPEGVWYHHLDGDVLERVIEKHLKDGRPVEENVFYRLDDEAAPEE